MPVDPYAVAIVPATVTDIGVTIDYSGVGAMGRVSIRNAGPDPVFVSINATPPSAAVQNGVFQIKADEAWNWDKLQLTSLGIITATGQTAVVETTASPASGSEGGYGS